MNFENFDFPKMYNHYALWIKDNTWAWRSGANKATQSFDRATRPNGLTAFAKKHYQFSSQAEVQKFQRKCSKFLTEHPEVLKTKSVAFAKMFPTLLQIKIKEKQQQDLREVKLRDANLRLHFDMPQEVQMEIPVETTVKSTTKLSELAETICVFAERGAKSIKSPDGWEIQF
jgi:hypothetical protein